MTRMATVTYLCFIIFSALLLAACSAESIDRSSFTGRSARWDAFTKNEREKRNTASMEWQDKTDHPSCTLTELTWYDQHQRRTNGVIAAPQLQGRCGNCWVFTATHVFTDYLRLTGSPSTPVFSQDYMSMCIAPFLSRKQQDYNGCCGGNPYNAFNFLRDRGGVSESCLPYSLSEYTYKGDEKRMNPLTCPSSCRNTALSFNPTPNRIGGPQKLNTEAEAMQALDQGRPIYASVTVDTAFRNYRCGVFCSDPRGKSNHAVEIVDYSSDSFPGTPYWVIKNSWGRNRGESGYMRIARGQNQIKRFVTILQADEQDTAPTDPSLLENSCDPQEPDTESENVMIESAAEFALETLQRINVFRCSNGSSVVPTVTLSSIVNDSIQVIDGTSLQGIANINVDGCTENTGTVEFVVEVDLDDNFSLEDYFITISDYVFSGSKGLVSSMAVAIALVLAAFVAIFA